jgi:hypothetical protein
MKHDRHTDTDDKGQNRGGEDNLPEGMLRGAVRRRDVLRSLLSMTLLTAVFPRSAVYGQDPVDPQCRETDEHPGCVTSDVYCLVPNGGTGPGYTKDYDCGQPFSAGDDDCGWWIGGPYGGWGDDDCGYATGTVPDGRDQDCGIQNRMGSSHLDNDCGLQNAPGQYNTDQACGKQGGFGTLGDNDCEHTTSDSEDCNESLAAPWTSCYIPHQEPDYPPTCVYGSVDSE